MTSGFNCIAQRATIAAISAPTSKIQYMVDEFNKEGLILNLLSKIPDSNSTNLGEHSMFSLTFLLF